MPISETVPLQVLSGAGGLLDQRAKSFHCCQEWYPLAIVKIKCF